jgi:hypothetical protein
MMTLGVPYLSFSAASHDLSMFFAMVEYASSAAPSSRSKPTGTTDRVSRARCGPWREGGARSLTRARAAFNRMRVRGDFDKTVDGLRNLRAAGVPIEINFSPAHFNIDEIGAVVDLAGELGAYSFYTGRTMYTGNAVKAWRHLEVAEDDYATFFDTLRAKAVEYQGRMRVYFHEAGLLEELRYRLREPAALLIVLPNGLVKLINALPFVGGYVRRARVEDIWALPVGLARSASQASSTSSRDPGKTRVLHEWIHL